MPDLADKQAAIRDRIEQLARRFLSRCAVDMVAARELLVRLRRGDGAASAELERLAHRIVGTGASLGFESVSDMASVIERRAESLKADAGPSPSATDHLAMSIGRLDEELARLARARE